MSFNEVELTPANSKEFLVIFQYVYGDLPDYKKFGAITESELIAMIQVVNSLPVNEQIAIRAYYRYGMDYHKASRMTGVDQKLMSRTIDIATRHLRSPICIDAIYPEYYSDENCKQFTNDGVCHPLCKEDFGGKKYILTALNKACIHTREALLKHLSHGWRYLWTIPGCGDGAREKILTALDEWGINLLRLK